MLRILMYFFFVVAAGGVLMLIGIDESPDTKNGLIALGIGVVGAIVVIVFRIRSAVKED